MQRAVADEAVALHLDKPAPWAERLVHARQQILQRAEDYEGDPNIPPAVMARWQGVRQHILWDAYFAQAATKEERDALMAKEKERYKVTVQDADFFNGPATQ